MDLTLEDVGGGDDQPTPHPSASSSTSEAASFSSTPLRMVTINAKRNASGSQLVTQGVAMVNDAIRAGAAAVTASGERMGERAARILDPSSSGSGGVGSSSASSAAVAPLPAATSRAEAFLSRLETCLKLLEQSSLAGSPSQSLAKVITVLSSCIRTAAALTDSVPHQTRAVSSKAITEGRQLYDSSLRDVRGITAEGERHILAFESRQGASTAAAISEAQRTVATMKDALLNSASVAQLEEDSGKFDGKGGAKSTVSSSRSSSSVSRSSSSVSRSSSTSSSPSPFDVTHSRVTMAAAAIPSHIASLRAAVTPSDVEREAECLLIAATEWCDALADEAGSGSGGGGTGGSATSSRSVPASLLRRITSESRRSELAGMSESRARLLLSHTRSAMAETESGSEAMEKLEVIAAILAIRAGEYGSGTGGNSAVSLLVPFAQRWRLRRAALSNSLSKLAATARIARQLAEKGAEERRRTVDGMRAAMRKAIEEVSARVTRASSERSRRWAGSVLNIYREQAKQIEGCTASLSQATLSALELFVGTGLLMNIRWGSGEGDDEEEEDEEEEDDAHSVNAWRQRIRGFEDLGNTNSSSSSSSSSSRSSGSTAAAPLLRRTHAMTLEAFAVWVELTNSLLETNAKGIGRAADAVDGSLSSPARKLREAITAHRNGGERG